MDIAGLVGIIAAVVMAGVVGRLLYEDNVRLRKRLAEIEDKYDTLMYALSDATRDGAYTLGTLVADVERAKIKREAEDVAKRPSPDLAVGSNPDRWKRRRANGKD